MGRDRRSVRYPRPVTTGRLTNFKRVGDVLRGMSGDAAGRLGVLAGPPAIETFCSAPFSSMYLDQFGEVRACCQHTDAPLGNVRTQSLMEIWNGQAVAELRVALRANDLSRGCAFCQWQTSEGSGDTAYARNFDRLATSDPSPAWPRQLEFSISNTCNLRCEMCNGDFSSSIRSQREHRAPLPNVYPESFFDELREVLPHVSQINVLGGEPFLSHESLRVLDIAAEVNPAMTVTIATNATIWNRRVSELVERLRPNVVVSIDGITAETFESVRVGADFARVMENLDRFDEAARRHGTEVSLAHCLMRSNWWEFADFLSFAERRGFDVGINTVVTPDELSLYQLPSAELLSIVSRLERRGAGVVPHLARHRHVWEAQIAALKNRAGVETDGAASLVPWHLPAVPVEIGSAAGRGPAS